MILKARGIMTLGKFTSFYTWPSIDISKLPTKIGDIPIGDSSWYKRPPPEYIYFDNEEHNKEIRPLRGSYRGIAATEMSGSVYAYEYRMAYLAGRRFARSGKRVFHISVKKHKRYSSQVWDIITSEFKNGFISYICGEETDHFCYDKRSSFWSENKNKYDALVSNIYTVYREQDQGFFVVNYLGLDDKKQKTLEKMAFQFCEGEHFFEREKWR